MLDTKEKKLRLLYDLNPSYIYVTPDNTKPVQNAIKFNIANKKDSPVVKLKNPAGLTPADEIPPLDAEDFEYDLSRFYIWFPWGAEPEDLATEDDAKIITCSPGKYNNSWYCKRMSDTSLSIIAKRTVAKLEGAVNIAKRTILNDLISNGYREQGKILIKKIGRKKKNFDLKLSSSSSRHMNAISTLVAESAIGTYWILFPKKETVLDAKQSVGFILDDIVSRTKTGMSYMHIQSSDIEGYEDTTKEVTFDKNEMPAPVINYFTAHQRKPIDFWEEVELSWDCDNADYCILNPGGNRFAASHTVKVAITPDIGEYTLTAFAKPKDPAKGEDIMSDPKTNSIEVNPLPAGTIVMWSGEIKNIPKGWVLCDGQPRLIDDRTITPPDLQDRFIMGASAANPVNSKNEADSHAHEIHQPAQPSIVTSPEGDHNHQSCTLYWYMNKADSGSKKTIVDANAHDPKAERTSVNGKHSHTVTVNGLTYSSEKYTGPNRPRWYALCFIMKI